MATMSKRSLRIGLDVRSIGQRVCGVSRVSSRIVQALSDIDKENTYIIYVDQAVSEWRLGANFEVKRTGCSRINLFYEAKFYSILSHDTLDILHTFHAYLPHLLPHRCKSIVTMHDIFSVTDPLFFIKYHPFHRFIQTYFSFLTQRTIKRADYIITVSCFSKNEICRVFSSAAHKIDVVYNAPGLTSGSFAACNEPDVNGNYLLYVGNCRSYKNIDVLLAGFQKYVSNNPAGKMRLVMAGNDYGPRLIVMIKSFGLQENIVTYTNPTDQEMQSLYKNAIAFVLPSKYEGFGIPVLEAMSFNVPVIISNAAALVEVAGDAALVFDQNKPEDLAGAIEKLVSDEHLQDELRRKGRDRVKMFTWEKSARQLCVLYESLGLAVTK